MDSHRPVQRTYTQWIIVMEWMMSLLLFFILRRLLKEPTRTTSICICDVMSPSSNPWTNALASTNDGFNNKMKSGSLER